MYRARYRDSERIDMAKLEGVYSFVLENSEGEPNEGKWWFNVQCPGMPAKVGIFRVLLTEDSLESLKIILIYEDGKSRENIKKSVQSMLEEARVIEISGRGCIDQWKLRSPPIRTMIAKQLKMAVSIIIYPPIGTRANEEETVRIKRGRPLKIVFAH